MTSDTLWPPSDSDTSWSPLSDADSPGTLSPLLSLELEDMDSSALPVSSGALSLGALSSGALSSGALRSIDAHVQAWRMPPVEPVEAPLRRRETVRPRKADPPRDKPDATIPEPHKLHHDRSTPEVPAPPTPWDVVLRACETTRALGYVPGTLFALLVLPHLLTFAMVCAAANVARRALGTVRHVRLRPLAFVSVFVAAVYLTRGLARHAPVENTELQVEIARNARFMAEIRRELAVLRAQLKEVNRECAGASRFVGKTVRERCKISAEENQRVL